MSRAQPTWPRATRASAARPGVVLVTSGPGATNTVTGIADAYMDSTPMVVISGQVPTSLIGNDAFQEADIVGITRPCTKHNYLIKDVQATSRGSSRKPSISRAADAPVRWWSIYRRTCSRPSTPSSYPEKVELRGYKPTIRGNPRQIERADRGDRKERQAAVLRRRRRAMVGRGAGAYASSRAAWASR